jgi:hypothetical protein
MRRILVMQVLGAAEGIDQRAVLGLRHRVDGEVAALEVLLQRHLGRGVDREALVASAAFSLRPGQGIFFVRLGVEEHREILADRLEALGDHLLGRGTDHDVVALPDRQAEKLVAHGSANQVNLHVFIYPFA